MRSDEEGFLYPEIDKAACIECGLCERVCPFDRPTYANTPAPQVYASYVKDENQQVQSSSGGLFYAVSRWVIGQGGIVYGAAFDELFRLRHTGAETLEELRPLRGSKYLQSDLRGTFREIRAHLKAGRWVYFTGTGCQVAGLRAFLQQEYATLVTSDLVCHGTPSQQLFDWHLDYLRQKEQGEITSYSFRDMGGWGICETYNYVSQTRHKSGVRRLYSYDLSPYFYQFMRAFGYRYSCYHCPFARIPRQGDITLAEPGALIAFAGPRVIEQTIGEKLPEGFQRAEYLESHGFVDQVVPRGEMKAVLGRLLRLHAKGGKRA